MGGCVKQRFLMKKAESPLAVFACCCIEVSPFHVTSTHGGIWYLLVVDLTHWIPVKNFRGRNRQEPMAN